MACELVLPSRDSYFMVTSLLISINDQLGTTVADDLVYADLYGTVLDLKYCIQRRMGYPVPSQLHVLARGSIEMFDHQILLDFVDYPHAPVLVIIGNLPLPSPQVQALPLLQGPGAQPAVPDACSSNGSNPLPGEQGGAESDNEDVSTKLRENVSAWMCLHEKKDLFKSFLERVLRLKEATISGAKSMKGTPYWMAPEVILLMGHSISVDIWSFGCAMIEMAAGKPPWSHQFQEVAALLHFGMTRSDPPIPERLPVEAKDFLLKCLQKEPYLRTSTLESLQHPFVTGEYHEVHTVLRNSVMEPSVSMLQASGSNPRNSVNLVCKPRRTLSGLKDVCDICISARCSTIYPGKFSETSPIWGTMTSDDDTCVIDEKDDTFLGGSVCFSSSLPYDLNKSFNPMSELAGDWGCKFNESSDLGSGMKSDPGVTTVNGFSFDHGGPANGENNFRVPSGSPGSEDNDDITELKIREFLDEKAVELKKLETPLFEEYYNTENVNASTHLGRVLRNLQDENSPSYLKLPPKSRSWSQVVGQRNMLH